MSPDDVNQEGPHRVRRSIAWSVGVGATVLLLAGLVAVLMARASQPIPPPIPSPDLPTPTSQPTRSAPEIMHQVQTLCLSTEHSFTGLETPLSLPVQEGVSAVFSALEVHVLPAGSACDATLTITISGEALSAEYYPTTGGPAQTCYTGVDLQTQLTLVHPLEAPIDLLVRDHRLPKGGTILSCTSAKHAITKSWRTSLFDALVALWGSQEPLMAALSAPDLRMDAIHELEDLEQDQLASLLPSLVLLLDNPDWDLALAATTALAAHGSAARTAVPSLIKQLARLPVEGKTAAILQTQVAAAVYVHPAHALQRITGEDLGLDAEPWQEWWAANQ